MPGPYSPQDHGSGCLTRVTLTQLRPGLAPCPLTVQVAGHLLDGAGQQLLLGACRLQGCRAVLNTREARGWTCIL